MPLPAGDSMMIPTYLIAAEAGIRPKDGDV